MCLHVHTHAHTHTHTCTRTHTHTVCLSLKVRVLDMFFEEGSKVLYRLAVTCLVLYTEGLLGEPQWGLPATVGAGATALPSLLLHLYRRRSVGECGDRTRRVCQEHELGGAGGVVQGE